ncbi:hypothetical protein D3C84_711030 [compost metagenome]
MQGALAELVAQAGFQTARQTFVGNLLEARGRGIETLGVLDPPLGVGVDHHGFLFQGQEALGRCIQGHQARVELAHLVHVGHFHMQAWLDVGLDHATEAQHYRALGLGDDVEAVPGHDRQHHADDQGDQRFIAHQRLSLERNSRCCCCMSAAARAPASLAGTDVAVTGALPRALSTILSSGR